MVARVRVVQMQPVMVQPRGISALRYSTIARQKPGASRRSGGPHMQGSISTYRSSNSSPALPYTLKSSSSIQDQQRCRTERSGRRSRAARQRRRTTRAWSAYTAMSHTSSSGNGAIPLTARIPRPLTTATPHQQKKMREEAGQKVR